MSYLSHTVVLCICLLAFTQCHNSVAEIVIRGWNKQGTHIAEKDKQNNQINMDETKELLKFYFGDKEGQEVYDVVVTCINRGSGFTGKAENGMTVKLTGKSAGYVITITK